jgi:hypothetical protein
VDARRGHRAYRLYAALLSGRAQALRDRSGACAHPARGHDDAGLDGVGSFDDASAPLQGVGDRGCDHGDRKRRGAHRLARPAALRCDHRAYAHRFRRGHGLSGRDRLDPERRARSAPRPAP